MRALRMRITGVSGGECREGVLHGPSPVEQCRVVPVLGAKVLDQGHIVVEVERPDQGEQAGRLASDGGDRCDEPVVELHDLVNHRQVARPGPGGGEVRRGEVLGEHDRLGCQGLWSVVLGEMDEQLDVEGLVEGRHLPDGRAERGGGEGLEAGLGVGHLGQGRDEQGPDEMAEQDDDLVRLVTGAMRLGDRAAGPGQHRPVDPVTLAERAGHLVTGHQRRRQRAQLGQVRGQIRVGVADHVPAGAVRPRRIGPDRGGQRRALTHDREPRLAGRRAPVHRRPGGAAAR
jgi:hypothetical protein